MKDSFVFYKSWQDSLNLLPDSDSFKKVFNAICDFVFLKKEIEEADFTAHELTIIKMGLPLLAASIANYENGCKGGRPKKAENSTKTPLKTPSKRNDNDNDSENLKEYDTDNYTEYDNDTYNYKESENLNNSKVNSNNINFKKNTHFKKPTLEKVVQFCEEKNLGLDPQEFFEYYEKRDWENVFNWQALIIRWNNSQINAYMNKINGKSKQAQSSSSDPYAALR